MKVTCLSVGLGLGALASTTAAAAFDRRHDQGSHRSNGTGEGASKIDYDSFNSKSFFLQVYPVRKEITDDVRERRGRRYVTRMPIPATGAGSDSPVDFVGVGNDMLEALLWNLQDGRLSLQTLNDTSNQTYLGLNGPNSVPVLDNMLLTNNS
ncbi:MAG: hypothetical protein M1814_003399 [Vezdaea aestivalis]|nr:MAG: hypothetical protein M1814_003399 [Vezdaea aestivalis]